MDENSPVRNQVLVGVGVLLVVALLIGGIVGFVAIKAADVAGLGSDGETSDDGDSGPPVGLGTNTAPSETTTTDAGPTTTAPTTPSTPTETTTTTREPPKPVITLRASPTAAGTYERVNLTGSYPSGNGAELQVQRRLKGEPWADFPTDASVSGGAFSTYIETGRTGRNEFRMLDIAADRTSNVVIVQIG